MLLVCVGGDWFGLFALRNFVTKDIACVYWARFKSFETTECTCAVGWSVVEASDTTGEYAWLGASIVDSDCSRYEYTAW